MSSPSVLFYGNKICPFAHRGLIAAVERGLEYSYEHIPLGPEKPAWYAEKINPRGTVPSLKIREGKILIESMWVVEYIDDVQPGSKLVPEDAEERYDVKLFIDEFGRNCMFPMYKLLKNQDPAEDEAIANQVHEGLRKMNAALEAQSDGPYFLGERFSTADLAAAPFLHRFRATLPHYRGFDPLAGDDLERLRSWLTACESRESLKSTTLSPQEFIEKYVSYAGDRGQSKMGQ